MQFQQFSSSLLEGAKVTDGPPSFENEGAMAPLAPPLPTPLATDWRSSLQPEAKHQNKDSNGIVKLKQEIKSK